MERMEACTIDISHPNICTHTICTCVLKKFFLAYCLIVCMYVAACVSVGGGMITTLQIFDSREFPYTCIGASFYYTSVRCKLHCHIMCIVYMYMYMYMHVFMQVIVQIQHQKCCTVVTPSL